MALARAPTLARKVGNGSPPSPTPARASAIAGYREAANGPVGDVARAVVPAPPTGVSEAGLRPQPTPHLLPLVLLGGQLVQDARLHHLRTARARVTGSSSCHRARASTEPETPDWLGGAAPRGAPGPPSWPVPARSPHPGLFSKDTSPLRGALGQPRKGMGVRRERPLPAARGWEVVERLRSTRES